MSKSKCQMADGDRWNLSSVQHLHLTLGFEYGCMLLTNVFNCSSLRTSGPQFRTFQRAAPSTSWRDLSFLNFQPFVISILLNQTGILKAAPRQRHNPCSMHPMNVNTLWTTERTIHGTIDLRSSGNHPTASFVE